MRHSFQNYCKDIENVENFEKANADNFKGWHCHHRLETHNSDGERRLVDITRAELIALGTYYNRPASELIFLTISEHRSLHQKGKKFSEEHKNKLSEAKKGKKFSEEHKNKLSEAKKNMSAETQKKLSEAHKGKKMSEETKKKMSAAKKGTKYHLGKHWYNDGKINKRAYECPDGFIPGMLLIK